MTEVDSGAYMLEIIKNARWIRLKVSVIDHKYGNQYFVDNGIFGIWQFFSWFCSIVYPPISPFSCFEK